MNWEKLLSARRFGDKTKDVTHDQNRSRFEQDYDRIIFSQPFRRLQDKTQVFPLPEDDFVHTRLTHSLEVSSVGRSLGKSVGLFVLDKYPELRKQFSVHDFGSIVASASLAHDVGNPPFGHAGEDSISAFFLSNEKGRGFKERVSTEEWADLTNFEGNAQGFRIMNSPLYRGTELTFATLGAFTKYPRSSSSPKIEGRKSQKKYGYFQSNSPEFRQLAGEMALQSIDQGSWCRHPLAFLVEAADDICYGIIDFEDGCRLGLISFETYKNLLGTIIGDSFSEEKLERVSSMTEKMGILRALAISELVRQATVKFEENEEAMLTGDFDQALTSIIPSAETMQKIEEISVRDIYRSQQVLERETGGYAIIEKIMETFCSAAFEKLYGSPSSREKTVFRLLPQEIRIQLEADSLRVYQTLQYVTDYVSGLTDRYALKLFKIISGS